MKGISIGQLPRPWLVSTPARAGPAASRAAGLPRPPPVALRPQARCQYAAVSSVSTAPPTSPADSPAAIFDGIDAAEPSQQSESESASLHQPSPSPRSLPSPHPDRAPRSAKLAALHARLSLSSRVPLQTVARALVDPSADVHPRFNNSNLAFVGASLLQYHTSEWLVTRYPRLPMAIIFAAMKGYAGDRALQSIARSWGVEAAAAPGEEVDPGYLQFSEDKPTMMMHKWGYVRAEAKELAKYKWRRGMSSRVVFDDPFGNVVPRQTQAETSNGDNTKEMVVDDVSQVAHANFVRAVIGAIYLHCGSDSAKTFIKSHILSRQLDLANLFEFRLPERELTRLCNRENFEPPVARLLSETGRLSLTPVYVVGIYSGRDKLGEAAGPNLNHAKTAAAINALKSWYLYSPGQTAVPSDALAEDAAPWKPVYVDIGEIIC